MCLAPLSQECGAFAVFPDANFVSPCTCVRRNRPPALAAERQSKLMLSRKRALLRKFPAAQEVPHNLIPVHILTCFPYGVLRFILLAARPGVPGTLQAVKLDLRVLLTAFVGIGLRLRSAFCFGDPFALLRFVVAAIDLSPILRAVFCGKSRKAQIVLGTAAVRNYRV